jgi:short-subunit dehydrogenase
MKTNFFKNKVCWITGASSGIGAALAMELNASGALLILSGRNSEKLIEIRDAAIHPENIAILSFDIENINALKGITHEAWDLWGGIDYVYLNAGMAVRDMIVQTDMEMIEKVMNINFMSNVAIAKALLPLMLQQKSGCFVVTGSLSGKFGVPKLGAYSASKHALYGFFESLRAEYESGGIKVTMITAGFVRTNITMNALKGNGMPYAKMQNAVGAGISPESCAHQMIKAVSAGKYDVLIGSLEKWFVVLKRFFPGLVRWGMTKHPMKILRDSGLLNLKSYLKFATRSSRPIPKIRSGVPA